MIWLGLILLIPGGFSIKGSILYLDNPCDGTAISVDRTELGNKYTLNVPGHIKAQTRIFLQFDSTPTKVEPIDPNFTYTINSNAIPKNSFRLRFYKSSPGLHLRIYGSDDAETVPHILSIIYDDEEYCKTPKANYFNSAPVNRVGESNKEAVDQSCGRRKVTHTELIVQGQPTKPGDWPWHVAILRLERFSLSYICGGTLLSKTFVMTAAHCATIRTNPVVPDSLSIELGKYNLIGGDIAPQTREVFEVIIHPEFDLTINNDIALLKLKSEAVFTDYVQPACLWPQKSKLPTEDVFGTVAGWGFNQQNRLSTALQQVTIPIVSELDCLKSNPTFFFQKLNTNKFCAGFANGTSVCNGDSGGGLMVFVPDKSGDTDQKSGAWYVRGIVSLGVSQTNINICDPYQYTIFTDVDKYRSWLSEYLN